MGSKQALSNGNEPEELTALVAAFELQDQVRLELVFTVAMNHKKMDLCATGRAFEQGTERSEAQPWVLASVTRWGSEYRSLMGLFSSLLYALDFSIAEIEWDKTKENKA